MRSPVVAALAATLAILAPPATVAHAAQSAERRPALMLLNALPVAQETPGRYQREYFADWFDANGNGCDTRQEVLISERVAGRVVDCVVVAGRWTSVYDGVSTTDAGSFDIDHRVPLAEAWASGAWRWTAATRDAFANDLGYAASLIAVTMATNRGKGDREPDEWMPPLGAQRCGYVKLWIGVKYRWGLAVDAQEKSYLARQLSSCPSSMGVPRRAPVRTNPNATRPGQ